MDNNRKKLNLFWDNLFAGDEKSEEQTRIEFLRAFPFFKNLNNRQIKRIGRILHEREYHENEKLFEYGNPGAALFLVQYGEISIEIPEEGSSTQVTMLSGATFLGELALLSDEVRTATARAIKKTKCLALYRNDLVALMETDPEIAGEIFRSLASVIGRRLIATTKLINNLKKEREIDESAA